MNLTMVKECMLSTIDNPFNPFEQFTSWLLFDKEKGYNCCERLARIAQYSEDMTDLEIAVETERAIDRIIELDFMDVYKKVIKETKNNEDNEQLED